jgi:hypothetical protein
VLPVTTTAVTLARLGAAFSFAKVEQATFRLYVEELSDIEPSVLDAAVSRVIRLQSLFPSVKEIRYAAAEIVLQLPREVEALHQAETRSRWTRDDHEDVPPPVHPLVKEAASAVGGFRMLRTSTEPGIVRGQFCRYYRELREAAIQEWCSPSTPNEA